jgi:outer membrane lipoprotein carrier protein
MKKTLTLAAILLLAAGAARAQEAGRNPWKTLAEVRESLVTAGPTAASFVQVYVPAGFSSGEKEAGRLALALPDCLRWDYQQPYPKSFLLCGGVVHAWNPEDQTGRRYRVEKNEPGLDLLLLSVEDLKGRYQATVKPGAKGRLEIALTPKETLAEVRDAVLVVDEANRRVVEVSYHDREGNLTRFEITGYRGVPRQGRFSPPGGIRWEEPR